MEKDVPVTLPEYDPKCYLCPGNARAGGQECQNPKYSSTFTFTNDFPAVKSQQPYWSTSRDEKQDTLENRLLQSDSVRGECKVICFSPQHNLTIARMTIQQIISVIEAWTDLYKSYIHTPHISYVQIFENKGDMMGCSNPHPHGQCWATEQLPEEPRRECLGMQEYNDKNKTCLLCDYARLESYKKVRVVCENDAFICVVPWWGMWPFETLIVSKSHSRSLLDFTEADRLQLGEIMRAVTCRYDHLFDRSFPYSMGVHQAPCLPHLLGEDFTESSKSPFSPSDSEAKAMVNNSHFHMHFYPPLLRSATVKKFFTGFEMFGTAQRDLTSEQAAARLRDLPDKFE